MPDAMFADSLLMFEAYHHWQKDPSSEVEESVLNAKIAMSRCSW